MTRQSGEIDLVEAIHKGLRSIGGKRTSNPQLSALALYEEVCGRPTRAGNTARPSEGLFLRRCLRDFRQEYPEEAEILTRRFIEDEGTKAIADQRFASQEQVNRAQRFALVRFAEWIEIEEQRVIAANQAALFNAMPPATYDRLFGATVARRKLGKLLKSQNQAWVIALTGLGGIGKSSIVDSAIRDLIPSFPYKRLVWLRLESGPTRLDRQALISKLATRLLPATTPIREQRPTLRNLLKTNPTLIVLDNLDAELGDVVWVDLLQDLANPSRFVLTSRKPPSPLARSYVLPVGELQLSEAKKLLFDQARQIGLEHQTGILRKQASFIYQRTGGHPLALKLVVGLLRSRPIDSVIEALSTQSHKDVAGVYAGIYKECWLALSRQSQKLLLAMPLAGQEGASLDQIKAITSLSKMKVEASIDELCKCSLLELRGTSHKPRYGIHQLTLTFLTKQIFKWN